MGMPAPSTPLAPVPPGHGIVLDPATRLADEGHLLLGGCPTRVVRLSSAQVSVLLCLMAGATSAAPGARALAAHLVAAGLAHPAPPSAPHRKGPAPDEVPHQRRAASAPGLTPHGGGVLAGAEPSEAATSGGRGVRGQVPGQGGAPGTGRTSSRVPRSGDGPGGSSGPDAGRRVASSLGTRATPEEGSVPGENPRGRGALAGTQPEDAASGRSGAALRSDAVRGVTPGKPHGTGGTPQDGGAAPGEPFGPGEGDSGRDGVLVLVGAGVCPEPGWLAPALAHLDDPRVGAVVPGAVVDEQDRGDAGPLRAALAALLTRLTLHWPSRPQVPSGPPGSELPGTPVVPGRHAGEHAVEHACDDPPRRVPALVVRRSALPAPGAAPHAPEADTAHLPPAGVLSRTLPSTLPGALVADGWSVRHEPCSRVRVEPLRGFGAYLSACFELGAATGEERRHGAPRTCAAGPEVSWVGVAALALALSGRPAGGACVALIGYTAAAAVHRLPPKTAVRAVGACASDDARALGRAAEQGWAPVAGALALRHPVAAAAVVASAALSGRSTPARSAAVVAGAAARSAGTWWGAWRARSAAALVPRVHTPLAARDRSRR